MIDKKSKRKDQINNFQFQDDLETIKIELAHYPHHVLARALLAACKLIIIMDPENTFVPEPKEVSSMDKRKLILLARDISSHIMEAYLADKQEIDKELLKDLH